MVSVTRKESTHRIAIAVSSVSFSNPAVYDLIAQNGLKKGDALSTARLAGIMASKNTATLIPLCHTLPLGNTEVNLELTSGRGNEYKVGEGPFATFGYNGFGGVAIEAVVQCHGPTGVEMEALTAAQVAAMTVYDMCKAVDKGMQLGPGRVVLKTGGKSGSWVDRKYKSVRSDMLSELLGSWWAVEELELLQKPKVMDRPMKQVIDEEMRVDGEVDTVGSAEEVARLLADARAKIKAKTCLGAELEKRSRRNRRTWAKKKFWAALLIANQQIRLENDIKYFMKILAEKRAVGGSEGSERGQSKDLSTRPSYEDRLMPGVERTQSQPEEDREASLHKDVVSLLHQWNWGDEIPAARREEYDAVAARWARTLVERRRSKEERGEVIDECNWYECPELLKPSTALKSLVSMEFRLREVGFDTKALDDWRLLLKDTDFPFPNEVRFVPKLEGETKEEEPEEVGPKEEGPKKLGGWPKWIGG